MGAKRSSIPPLVGKSDRWFDLRLLDVNSVTLNTVGLALSRDAIAFNNSGRSRLILTSSKELRIKLH